MEETVTDILYNGSESHFRKREAIVTAPITVKKVHARRIRSIVIAVTATVFIHII